MPYSIKKAPKSKGYFVVDTSGKKYSSKPIPLTRAKKQLVALHIHTGHGLDDIVMPKQDFIKEHKKLLNVLEKQDPKQLQAEYNEQSKELKKVLKRGGSKEQLEGKGFKDFFKKKVLGKKYTVVTKDNPLYGTTHNQPRLIHEEVPYTEEQIESDKLRKQSKKLSKQAKSDIVDASLCLPGMVGCFGLGRKKKRGGILDNNNVQLQFIPRPHNLQFPPNLETIQDENLIQLAVDNNDIQILKHERQRQRQALGLPLNVPGFMNLNGNGKSRRKRGGGDDLADDELSALMGSVSMQEELPEQQRPAAPVPVVAPRFRPIHRINVADQLFERPPQPRQLKYSGRKRKLSERGNEVGKGTGGGVYKDRARELVARLIRESGRQISLTEKRQIDNVLNRAELKLNKIKTKGRTLEQEREELVHNMNRLAMPIDPNDDFMDRVERREAEVNRDVAVEKINDIIRKQNILTELEQQLRSILEDSDIRTIPANSDPTDVISMEPITTGQRMIDVDRHFFNEVPSYFTRETMNEWANQIPVGRKNPLRGNIPPETEHQYIAHIEGEPRPVPVLDFPTTKPLNLVQRYITEPLQRLLKVPADLEGEEAYPPRQEQNFEQRNPMHGLGKYCESDKHMLIGDRAIGSGLGLRGGIPVQMKKDEDETYYIIDSKTGHVLEEGIPTKKEATEALTKWYKVKPAAKIFGSPNSAFKRIQASGLDKITFVKKYLKGQGIPATKKNVAKICNIMDVEGVVFD